METHRRTIADLARTLHRLNQGDLFAHRSDPEVEAARQRFHRRMARRRRREAIVAFLREPWTAWAASGDAARIARRFLLRHPDFDFPDPAYDLRTDRQAAAEYHGEEEANEHEAAGKRRP